MIRASILLALLLLSSCNEAQDPQERYGTYSAAVSPWRGESEALAPPDGTVAQGAMAREAVAQHPPEVNSALLVRGETRFEIFCAPCHGNDGYGDGIVVARGFPKPPSFHGAQLRTAPAQLLYDSITNGYGAMYSYADRLSPRDRWAVIAYIRALQLSQLRARGGAP